MISSGNSELRGSVRNEKFLSYLNHNQLLKNYTSSWIWRDNIKIVLKLLVCDLLDSIHLILDRNKVFFFEHRNKPYESVRSDKILN